MIKEKGQKRRGMASLALPLALAAILVGMPSTIWAQSVVISGGTAADGVKADLNTAVTDYNAVAAANDSPIFTINSDQTVNRRPSVDGVPALDLGTAGGNRLTDVSLLGGTNGAQFTINLATAGGQSGAIVSIKDVQNDITISGLKFTGGENTSTSAVPGNRNGGALHIGQTDPGNTNTGFGGTFKMDTVTFDRNKVDLSATPNGNAAFGGGLSVVNLDAAGGSQGKIDWKQVDFTDNTAQNHSTVANQGGNAIGGGARILGVAEVAYKSSTVSGNTATVQNQSHAHGGGMAIEGNAYIAALEQITFTNNTANASGVGVDGVTWARGGALFGLSETGTASTLTSTDSAFTGNKATAQGAVAHAEGGAVAVLGNVEATFSGNTFSSNEATSVNASAKGGAVASNDYNDGTLHQTNTMKFTSTSFDQNKATGGTSAQGGAVYALRGAEFTGGTMSKNIAEATGTNGSAQGGAVYADNLAASKINNVLFRENEAKATGINGTARGGAVYAATNLNAASGSNSFTSNKATGASAQGGAVYAATAYNANSEFFNSNVATGSNGNAQGGAVYSAQGMTMNGGTLGSNAANSSNGIAQGGAVYAANGAVNISDASITSNEAKVSSGNGVAQGGAVHAANGAATLSASNITGNSAISNTGMAEGGAVYASGKVSATGTGLSSSISIANNKAESASSEARGGAIAANNGAELEYAYLQNNSANGTLAKGGALYLAGATASTVKNSTFEANAASGASGYGGAAFVESGSNSTFENTDFVNNTATAGGGAIYANTNGGLGTTTVNLTSNNASGMEISGNKVGTASNGIEFGNMGGNSTADGRLNIDSTYSYSNITMNDSLTVNMNNGTNFTMNKTGLGTLAWNNTSTINMTGGATANVNLSRGTVELGKDFVLKGNGVNVDITNTSTTDKTVLSIDTNRDASQAIFDFTGGSGTVTNSTSGTNGKVLVGVADTGRELVDFSEDYSFVKNGGQNYSYYEDLFEADSDLNTISFKDASGTEVILSFNYKSIYSGALRAAGPNTERASTGLAEILKLKDSNGDYIISDAEKDAIVGNLGTVTAEYGPASGVAAVYNTQSFHNIAKIKGFRDEFISTQWTAPPSAGSGGETGRHLWAAYVGNFQTVDKSKGYYGYDNNTNGGMIGISFEVDPAATIGFYGGATTGELKYDRIKSKVESNGVHLGAVARVNPYLDTDPGLSLYANVGYSQYDNDGSRNLGAANKVKSSYDQTLWTLAVGADYQIHLGNDTRVTPEAELRYTNLDQDGFTEKGLTASKVKSMEADSITTNLGVTLAKDVAVQGGFATPSLYLGWKHEFGDTDYDTTGQYRDPSNPNAPIGRSYKLATQSVDRDTFDVGVGVKAMFDTQPGQQLGVNLSYDFSTSKKTDSHSVYGGVEFRF